MRCAPCVGGTFAQLFPLLIVFWSCLAPSAAQQPPASDSPALLALSDGSLAARAKAADSWTLLSRSDRLPDACEVHSSAVAAGSIQTPWGVLHLAPGTRLQIGAAEQSISLEEGSVVINATSARSLTVAGLQCRIDQPAVLEATCDQHAGVTLLVRSGSIRVRQPGNDALELPPQSHWTWRRGSKHSELGPLDAADTKRIDALLAGARGQGLGQLLVPDPQSGSQQRLEIARYHAHVVLHPPVALVQIDQSFYNPYPLQQEGTFVFNLPAGSSVSRFAMYVTPQQLIEGEIVERQLRSEHL